MLAEDLGTWPAIVGIEDREGGWQRIGKWNMKVEELRKLLM